MKFYFQIRSNTIFEFNLVQYVTRLIGIDWKMFQRIFHICCNVNKFASLCLPFSLSDMFLGKKYGILFHLRSDVLKFLTFLVGYKVVIPKHIYFPLSKQYDMAKILIINECVVSQNQEKPLSN